MLHVRTVQSYAAAQVSGTNVSKGGVHGVTGIYHGTNVICIMTVDESTDYSSKSVQLIRNTAHGIYV